MENTSRQFIVIVALNCFLGLALFLGIHQTVTIVDFISKLTISSISELVTTVSSQFNAFMRFDIKVIFGIMFSAGIIFYDILLVIRWFISFSFTSKKSCKKCSQKLIREQRQFADRLISAVVPVKRFRCVGCGQEYLKLDRKSHEVDVPENSVQAEKIRV